MLFVLLVIAMKETSVEYFNMKSFDYVELKPPKCSGSTRPTNTGWV